MKFTDQPAYSLAVRNIKLRTEIERLRTAATALVETLADDDPHPGDHWYYPEWKELKDALEEEA